MNRDIFKLNLMRAAMADGRRLAGFDVAPFPIHRDDWREAPIIGFNDDEAFIVTVWASRRGALDRLISDIKESGRAAVIVGVIGPYMPRWLAKRNWVRSAEMFAGEMVDCWRAPAIAAAA